MDTNSPLVDERITLETPAAIDRDRAYWYARGCLRDNPAIARILVGKAAPTLPVRDTREDNEDLIADVLGNLFGSSFLKTDEGDIDRVFEEWIHTLLA
ncbi:hypothetical protein ACI2LF_11035 [Kribbella sp. NPDC020789]